MIRRKNQSIFLDGKATTTILQVKEMVQGITKKPADEQQLLLWKENQEYKILEDNKTLGDYGMTLQTAKAQSPASLVVAYRQDGMKLFYRCNIAKFFECLTKVRMSQEPNVKRI